jgi:hypothetical protein
MPEKKYTEADMLKAIDQTRASAQLHNKASQETKDFMQQTKDTFEKIEAKIDALPTAETIKIAVLEANKTFLEEAEKRFAPKWVEKVMVWGMRVVGTAILLAGLSLILIK